MATEEQQQAEERLKLAWLKRLAADAFDAIDHGDHVTVTIGELDTFLDSLGNTTRRRRCK